MGNIVAFLSFEELALNFLAVDQLQILTVGCTIDEGAFFYLRFTHSINEISAKPNPDVAEGTTNNLHVLHGDADLQIRMNLIECAIRYYGLIQEEKVNMLKLTVGNVAVTDRHILTVFETAILETRRMND